MRQVAGEPEQLELEREDERIERRPPVAGLHLVEEVEEAREGDKGPVVPLLLREELQHGLEADEADRQTIVAVARGAVRTDQLDARDRLQLPPPLVEDELDVAHRLQPAAETGLCAADPLRDRADPAAIERVQVQHPVGLTEAHGAEDDRLRLVGSTGHGRSVEAGSAGKIA